MPCSLTKFHILFHCLLDGEQFTMPQFPFSRRPIRMKPPNHGWGLLFQKSLQTTICFVVCRDFLLVHIRPQSQTHTPATRYFS